LRYIATIIPVYRHISKPNRGRVRDGGGHKSRSGDSTSLISTSTEMSSGKFRELKEYLRALPESLSTLFLCLILRLPLTDFSIYHWIKSGSKMWGTHPMPLAKPKDTAANTLVPAHVTKVKLGAHVTPGRRAIRVRRWSHLYPRLMP
jgi:hypothetical protein